MKIIIVILSLLNPMFWIRNRKKFAKATQTGFTQGVDRAIEKANS